jgi:2-methylcitrate dehydratase PrpD
MTSQHDNASAENSIDRRLFLGAAGALTLASQSAPAQEARPGAVGETPPQTRRLSDTIADFVTGFDAASLPPLAIERMRLAFVDTFAVTLAGSREEGAAIICEMVQQEGAAPKVSVVGQSFRTSPQLAALANGVAAHIMDYDFSSVLGQPTSPVIPALPPLAESVDATPAEVTAAFIVGYEVCQKLARTAPEQTLAYRALARVSHSFMRCSRMMEE